MSSRDISTAPRDSSSCIRFFIVHPRVVSETYLRRATKIGKKFQNLVPTEIGSVSLLLKMMVAFATNREERVPKVPVGPFRTDATIYATPPTSGLRITWFGHAGFLLEMDGVTLLMDPVWDERASPVTFAGPKRFFAPTIALKDLPRLDAIVISHDHYDHLGEQTVRELARLRPEVRWITSLGVGDVLVRFGALRERITELDWTEEMTVLGPDGAALRITSIPTRHFSGRAAWNRFETLWAGFVMKSSRHSVYCGADTGPWPGIAEIGAAYGPFDVTMLEIGAWSEYWPTIHLGPEAAVDAFAELGGGVLMPIHWGLFDLALHAWRWPMQVMTERAAEQGLRLFAPAPGTPTEVPAHGSLVADWWR